MLRLTSALIAVALVGCARPLSADPPSSESMLPGLVCNAQFTTTLTLTATNLRPLPAELLTEGAALRLPDLALTRRTDLAGSASEGAPIDLIGASVVRWLSETTMELDISPELALAPGVYDLTITNPDGQSITLTGSLAVTPEPQITRMEDALVCVAQGPRAVTLTGSGFLRVGEALPEVDMGGVTLHPDAMEDCADLAGPVSGATCSTLTVTIPEDSLEPGLYDVSLLNPPTAGCETLAPVPFEVVPPPTLVAMEPALLCLEQGEEAVVLTGGDFLVVGGLLPSVDLGGVALTPDAAEDCAPLEGPVAGERCSTLRVTVPQNALLPSVYSATVHNPESAPCASTEEVRFEVVPAPTLAALAPQPNCLAQEDRDFVATGEHFLVLEDGTLPDVALGEVTVRASAARDCTALTGPEGGELCETLDFTLPEDALLPGIHRGSVACPSPADCVSNEVGLELIPPPALQAVADNLLCLEQGAVPLTLSGADFLKGADGALPWVAIGEDFYAPAESADGCVDLAGSGGGALCDTLHLTLPAEALAAGVHDLYVTNPISAECMSTELVSLEVVPRPALASVEPLLTCLDQGVAELLLEGSDFLTLEDGTLPEVEVGSLLLPADSAAGCEDLAGPAGGQRCTELRLTLPQDTLPEGIHAIQVINPAPAACVSDEVLSLETRAAPVVVSVDSALVCDAQGDVTLTLTGAGFLQVGGALPVVRLGSNEAVASALSDCVPLSGGEPGAVCTSLSVTVPAGALAEGLVEVTVQNPAPADCVSELPVALENVSPPLVTAVLPEAVCDEAGAFTLALEGSGFLRVDGALPSVQVGAQTWEVATLSGCTALLGTAGGERCTGITAEIPAGSYPALGAEEIFVQNPAPAACVSPEGPALEITPPPQITGSSPALSCSGGTLRVTGSGFSSQSMLSVGGAEVALEQVESGLLSGEIPSGLALGVPLDVALVNPADCEDVLEDALTLMPPPTLTAVSQQLACSAQNDLIFTLDGTDFITMGSELPSVTLGGLSATADSASLCSPIPGGQACQRLTVTFPAGSLPSGLLEIYVQNPAPADCETNVLPVEVIAPPAVLAVNPVEQCWEVGAFELEISGSGFLDAGALPEVTIGGARFTASEARDCVSLSGPEGGSLCETLRVRVPADTWDRAQTLPVTVINPDPASCQSTDDTDFTLYDPPRIEEIEPLKVCGGDSVIRITGTGFRPTPEVEFNGIPAGDVLFLSDTELEVLTPADMVPDDYAVRVINPDTCEDTEADPGLIVVEPPIVFFVDPPVQYNAVPIQATVYVAGINDDLVRVWLENAESGDSTEITDFTWDPSDPLRVSAVLPASLPRGSYHVFIEDEVGCEVNFPDALYQEDTPTLTIDRISPSFGWENGFTPVVVEGDDFADLPRVYLSPDTPTLTSTATELRGVVWTDAQTLDAIVPSALAAGSYDLIVVNPDRSVGFLEDAYRSMLNPPPVIDSAAPASVSAQPDQAVTLAGSDYSDPTVQLECQDPTVVALPVLVDAEVLDWDSTWVDLLVPGDLIGKSVCTVILTNADGAEDSFAAISVVEPSDNLYAWRATSLLQVPRRATAAVTGRVTRTQRYLFAFGGDGGNAATALDSYERAQVDVYGGLSAWIYDRKGEVRSLPVPLTQAGVAQIGRFIYLVGGNSGAGARSSVYRAQVLDPLQAPRVTDLDLARGSGVELEGGTWSYRVAALFGASDLANPGGETLPSDPFTVHLPELPERLALTLHWTAVPGAVGYRIYRSPEADMGSRAEVFLADVGAVTSFTDRAAQTTNPAIVPHQPGNLGEWAQLPAMSVARQAPAVATAQDPADPSVWYLYAAGGSDGGTYRKDIEILPVTLSGEHTQEVGSWRASSRVMSDGRDSGNAWVVDDRLHTVQNIGDTWIYFGSGWKAAGSVSTSVDVGLLQAGGDLASWQSISKAINPGRAGAGSLSASNYLYSFGGQSGAPTSGGISMAIDPDAVPLLENGNNLGKQMNQNRVYFGTAAESSVLFAVGGLTDSPTAPVTRTVDYTNF